MKNHIVAVVGMCGSGKSELTKMFTERGYARIYFGDVTIQEVKRQGLPVNESNEKKVREALRKEHGAAAYAKIALPQIETMVKTQNVVLDGLYSWSEYTLLRQEFGNDLVVAAVVTNRCVRQRRLENRAVRPLNNDEVNRRDCAEIENLEKGGPIAIADYYFLNNGSLDTLQKQFEEFIGWEKHRAEKA